MRVRTMVAAAVGGALLASPAWGQHETQPGKPMTPGAKAPMGQPGEMDAKTKEMMAAMEAAGKPGPNHEAIAQLAGEWQCAVKYQMDPSQPWAESQGSARAQMLYDGRYLHEEFTGDFAGAPFKGTAVLGYNNLSKQFQSVWIDNMSTQIEVATGTYDAATKTFTLAGQCDDPMTGKAKHTKEVTTINSADKHTSLFYEVGTDGKETKVMEIVYTRGKGPMMDQHTTGKMPAGH